MNIYVSGIGIVSSLGIGVEKNKGKLIKEISGIAPLAYLNSIHKEKLPVGEVKFSDPELKSIINLQESELYSRTYALALIAAKEAVQMAALEKRTLESSKIGIISSSTAGGMRESEIVFKDFLEERCSTDFMSTHDGADTTERLAMSLGINGFHTSINTACSSSVNAIILGARMIKNGLLDIVLVGGADALSKFTINGFNSLLLLDKEQCKPFDEKRKGINLGEGAGFLILECEDSIAKRNISPIAKLTGYSNTNDAFHPSATSADGKGLQLSMQGAIEMAGLETNDIDYINAHGTATLNNDLTEGMAMKIFFDSKPPPFSSTKSYTGHCLGAAGAIEAIYSIIALQENTLFSNLNFKEVIVKHQLIPQLRTARKKNISNVLSNSSGMGGFCSSLIFSRV